MDSKIFQDVFDLIIHYIPESWKKIVFTAMYTKGSYSMKFYYSDGEVYTDCFSIPGISRPNLIKTFMAIDKVLAKERSGENDKGKWTVFTMVVGEDGNMRTELEYDDHSENMVGYEKKWQEKYLK